MMSRFFLLLFGFLAVARAACAQQADQDVVYLKNGSVIHGIVVEARPDMVRLVNGYGDIFVFEMSDIEKIIKDSSALPSPDASSSKSFSDADFLGCPSRGYRGFVDANVMVGRLVDEFDCYDDFNKVGFLTTHGFQFNPKIFVGGGLGVMFQAGDDLVEDFDVIIPVYSAFRYDILARKVSPFLDVRLGGFFNAAYDYAYTGAYFSFTAGVRVRRFNVSIGYEALSGYYDGYYEDVYGCFCDSYGLDCNSFVLRLGADFGRRR